MNWDRSSFWIGVASGFVGTILGAYLAAEIIWALMPLPI